MPEIFQYSFMVRALVAGMVIGLVAPMIGMFLVLRRFAIFADALGHAALMGVAMGVLLGISPVLAALVMCVVVALIVEQLRALRRLPSDAMLALLLSGSLAIAIVIISISQGLNLNIMSYLFGSITTVQITDLWVILGLGVLALLVIVGLFKELFYISFDEESARVSGLPIQGINLILVGLAALTVALAMRIVGILLVGALMVIPVLTAFQIASSFGGAFKLAVIFSLVSVFTGLVSSYYLNVAAGGAIVVVALSFFLISLAFRRA